MPMSMFLIMYILANTAQHISLMKEIFRDKEIIYLIGSLETGNSRRLIMEICENVGNTMSLSNRHVLDPKIYNKMNLIDLKNVSFKNFDDWLSVNILKIVNSMIKFENVKMKFAKRNEIKKIAENIYKILDNRNLVNNDDMIYLSDSNNKTTPIDMHHIDGSYKSVEEYTTNEEMSESVLQISYFEQHHECVSNNGDTVQFTAISISEDLENTQHSNDPHLTKGVIGLSLGANILNDTCQSIEIILEIFYKSYLDIKNYLQNGTPACTNLLSVIKNPVEQNYLNIFISDYLRATKPTNIIILSPYEQVKSKCIFPDCQKRLPEDIDNIPNITNTRFLISEVKDTETIFQINTDNNFVAIMNTLNFIRLYSELNGLWTSVLLTKYKNICVIKCVLMKSLKEFFVCVTDKEKEIVENIRKKKVKLNTLMKATDVFNTYINIRTSIPKDIIYRIVGLCLIKKQSIILTHTRDKRLLYEKVFSCKMELFTSINDINTTNLTQDNTFLKFLYIRRYPKLCIFSPENCYMPNQRKIREYIINNIKIKFIRINNLNDSEVCCAQKALKEFIIEKHISRIRVRYRYATELIKEKDVLKIVDYIRSEENNIISLLNEFNLLEYFEIFHSAWADIYEIGIQWINLRNKYKNKLEKAKQKMMEECANMDDKLIEDIKCSNMYETKDISRMKRICIIQICKYLQSSDHELFTEMLILNIISASAREFLLRDIFKETILQTIIMIIKKRFLFDRLLLKYFNNKLYE